MIYVRKEQAELLLRLQADVADRQERLNTALGGVVAGILPDGWGVSEVRIEGERGLVIAEEPSAAPA